jgi:uncharacterized protein YbbK (DUF523 family)
MVRDGAAGAASGVRVPRSVAAINGVECRDAARDRAMREYGDDADRRELHRAADEVRSVV